MILIGGEGDLFIFKEMHKELSRRKGDLFHEWINIANLFKTDTEISKEQQKLCNLFRKTV